MRATIRLILMTAIRDRLLGGLFVLLGLASALSVFLASTALSEQLQAAIVFAAGAGRIILIFGLTIFAAFHIQGLLETREVEAVLSRAISRSGFVVAYWLGLSLLALMLSLAFGAVIIMFAGGAAGSLLWAGSLLAETMIVMAVAVFAGLMLERATLTVMFTAGFYALARLMGFFAGIRESIDSGPLNNAIKALFDVVLLFVPRLDLFAQTRWIIYGPAQAEWGFIALQTGLFLVLVLAAAVFDLSRKQF